jgi:hypothetical protein
MDTSALKNIQLRWAVAKCEGLLGFGFDTNHGDFAVLTSEDGFDTFAPDIRWHEGGPIIERERISVGTYDDGWCADITAGDTGFIRGFGPTPLIAGMRCYVASKLGSKVELPEGLK